jgi:parallel beta-helix repeat protein
VLALALLFVGGGAAQAAFFTQQPSSPQATRYVDDNDNTCSGQSPCYAGIQDAVDAANSGDTIIVAAGTYTEVIVTKPLILLGNQNGFDARNRNTPDESVVTCCVTNVGNPAGFLVQVGNVTIDGFQVQSASSPSATGPGIYLFGSTTGNKVLNNILQNNVFGLYLNSSGGAQTLVQHNYFSANNVSGPANGNGIYTDQGLSNALIVDNRFTNQLSAAIFLGDNDTNTPTNPPIAPHVSNVTISGNYLLNDAPIFLYATTNSTITNNLNYFSTGAGIYLGGRNNGISITANVVDHAAPAFSAIRIRNDYGAAGDANQNVTLTCNTLTNNDWGVRIASDGYTGSMDARYNTFSGNATAGAQNDSSATVDASRSYWGSPTGPTNGSNPGGTGDAVIGNVNFMPFATSTLFCPNGNPPPTATTTSTTTSTSTATATRTSTATTVPSVTATACTITFADVPPAGPGSTFYTFIRCLACRGIVTGYPCGGPGEGCNGNEDAYYRPGANVSRGQLSKIIANSAGLNDDIAEGQQQFADVEPGDPFYIYVERLAQTGAIAGYPCDTADEGCDALHRPYFRPNNPATRGQISKIVSIAAGFNEEIPAEQQTFTDVPTDSPFWVYIERLAAREIISGYGEASKCPETGAPCFRYNDYTSRGQMAKIAANTFFPNCQTPARK